jgi:hypothetical protein
MQLSDLLKKLEANIEQVEFEDVMAIISDNYRYSPCSFNNGNLINDAGKNEGSCKIFAFAKLHGLSEQATLGCFGRYYREDVLLNPLGDDHGNIRSFIKNGWQGIVFSGVALS